MKPVSWKKKNEGNQVVQCLEATKKQNRDKPLLEIQMTKGFFKILWNICMYIFTYVFLDIYTQSHAHARAHTYTHAYFKLISSSNQYKLAKFSFYEINQFGR